MHMAEAEVATGHLPAARQHADQAVAAASKLGLNLLLMFSLLASARVAAAMGDAGRAHEDAHQALTIGHSLKAQTGIIMALESLGELAGVTEDHDKAARLLGAADALRHAIGFPRSRLHLEGHDAAVAAIRALIGDAAFAKSWDEGAALTSEDAVSYALRGRGERGRPPIGWLSLTPAERDVARLVAEGLANKDIAARLFVSPRTVQTHLTHVYGKLGIASRVQLAREASRHA